MKIADIPQDGAMWLCRARMPGDADGSLLDIEIADGKVSRMIPSSDTLPAGGVDLDGAQVWPAFVDIHTHLDKGHILPRAANPDGSVYGAVRAAMVDREAHWSAADVRRRFEFGLRCAYAHGTAAIRTHIDADAPQAAITWPVFCELREQWAGRIVLQGVGKLPVESYLTSEGEELAALMARGGGILGAVTRIFNRPPDEAAPILETAINTLFQLAQRYQLELDLHVDESGDPAADSLRLIAKAAIRYGFQGRVVCGHCCSLAVQPEKEAAETIALCAEAGLAIVTLPMVNMYLQARSAIATPRWRGITLVHELARSGVPVAIASDNCRDPFFAFGDLDMLEVFAQSVRIAHLDMPYGDWPAAATSTPARLMGLPGLGQFKPGASADLVLFRARSFSELLARPQADRIVLRNGKPIRAELPDYRELDDLFT